MRSKKLLFLLAALALCWGCRRSRPALIPEIGPPLVQEEVCAWTGNLAGDFLFPCGGGIGWVDAAGGVIVWEAGKKTAAPVFAVPFPVNAPPFLQNGFLVLRDPTADRLLVYDLAARAVKFDSRNMGAGRVLGTGPAGLAYLDGGRPAVLLWERPTEAFHAAEADESILNCHFSPERILMMGRERLYTFWIKSGAFESEPLPLPAASPFYLDGRCRIIMVPVDRYLVKYSTAKKRLSWKLKLGQMLQRQPVRFRRNHHRQPRR